MGIFDFVLFKHQSSLHFYRLNVNTETSLSPKEKNITDITTDHRLWQEIETKPRRTRTRSRTRIPLTYWEPEPNVLTVQNRKPYISK